MLVDIVCKILFFGKEGTIIPGLIGIRRAKGLNTGGAWGFMSEYMWILVIITLFIFCLIAAAEYKLRITHPLYTIAMGLIVGGACGNLVDRIFIGGVRDFLYFEFAPSFPTFNVADSILCVGMALLVIYIFFVKSDDEKQPEK